MIQPLLFLASSLSFAPDTCEGEPIFPPERLHNHASCIVELPAGELLACWYRGSGERQADDVAVMGARRKAGAAAWSAPFVLADTPGFPDTNPCMLVDAKGRLWLFWPVILANEWHTALLAYKVSSSPGGEGPPRWDDGGNLLLKPGPEFAATLERGIADLKAGAEAPVAAVADAWAARVRKMAGEKLATRIGWMPRVHPTVLSSGRIVLPLYSDGFDFSLMALSDDLGATWQPSEPLVGGGNVQPSVVERKDGSLAAFMRDNGLPPKRVLFSESRDRGKSWSRVVDLDIPNPGAGLEVIALREGPWLMVNNDTERGRHSLAVTLSPDEGKTWPWKRHLEPSRDLAQVGSASYPSVLQAKDGSIHVTYSRSSGGETIWHARFGLEWAKGTE